MTFSRDGRKWTAPEAVLDEGMWLWRVTWHEDRAWGVAKYGSPKRMRSSRAKSGSN